MTYVIWLHIGHCDRTHCDLCHLAPQWSLWCYIAHFHMKPFTYSNLSSRFCYPQYDEYFHSLYMSCNICFISVISWELNFHVLSTASRNIRWSQKIAWYTMHIHWILHNFRYLPSAVFFALSFKNVTNGDFGFTCMLFSKFHHFHHWIIMTCAKDYLHEVTTGAGAITCIRSLMEDLLDLQGIEMVIFMVA